MTSRKGITPDAPVTEIATDDRAHFEQLTRRWNDIPDGRADLLIDLPAARIVIEIKTDAGEQPDQCGRMVRTFDTDEAASCF